MICRNCGAENDSGKFCFSCGAPLSQPEPQPRMNNFASQADFYQDSYMQSNYVETAAHVPQLTKGGAIGIMCLNFLHLIPLVGTLAWIIVMIVLSCKKSNPNRAAMCTGLIVWFFIPLIILIIVIAIFGAAFAPYIGDILNQLY